TSGSGAGAAGDPGTTNSATKVQLSDTAQALLQQIAANQTGAQKLPASFDELVSKKTSDLAASLVKAFTDAHIPLDDPISLHIDSAGDIRAEGPYQKRIEQYFKDNPDVAKEYKTVATLNALKATEQALALYEREKQAATTDKGRAEASDRYLARS